MPKGLHGGKRVGAGRPPGSRMRRSDVLAEELIAAGKCPVAALVRLAERAEQEGEIAQAVAAWKGILPYIYPKPKAVELEPQKVIDLARDLAEVRLGATKADGDETYGLRLERAVKKIESALSDPCA